MYRNVTGVACKMAIPLLSRFSISERLGSGLYTSLNITQMASDNIAAQFPKARYFDVICMKNAFCVEIVWC